MKAVFGHEECPGIFYDKDAFFARWECYPTKESFSSQDLDGADESQSPLSYRSAEMSFLSPCLAPGSALAWPSRPGPVLVGQ